MAIDILTLYWWWSLMRLLRHGRFRDGGAQKPLRLKLLICVTPSNYRYIYIYPIGSM